MPVIYQEMGLSVHSTVPRRGESTHSPATSTRKLSHRERKPLAHSHIGGGCWNRGWGWGGGDKGRLLLVPEPSLPVRGGIEKVTALPHSSGQQGQGELPGPPPRPVLNFKPSSFAESLPLSPCRGERNQYPSPINSNDLARGPQGHGLPSVAPDSHLSVVKTTFPLNCP